MFNAGGSEMEWELGNHLLINSNSENINYFGDLVFTDPPFDLDFQTQKKIIFSLSHHYIVIGNGINYHKLITDNDFKFWFETIGYRNTPKSKKTGKVLLFCTGVMPSLVRKILKQNILLVDITQEGNLGIIVTILLFFIMKIINKKV